MHFETWSAVPPLIVFGIVLGWWARHTGWVVFILPTFLQQRLCGDVFVTVNILGFSIFPMDGWTCLDYPNSRQHLRKLPHLNGDFMKLIKGARTMRRYSIDGKPDQSESDWLTQIQNHSQAHAFENAENNQRTEEQFGWVTGGIVVGCRLLSNGQVVFWTPTSLDSFDVDKKTLLSNLFRALFEMRVQEWLTTNHKDRIPKRDKDDIRDVLSAELYAKTS